MCEYLDLLEVKYEIDPKIVRGLDYYNHTVFELMTENNNLALGGGGRYDNMIGEFIGDGKKYPAVGISFGLDVIFDILKEKGNMRKTNTDVYIIPMGNNLQAMKIAQDLRNKNINVDIEMNNKKLKKSLDYANIQGIPFVIITGEDELKENKVIIKNMKTGLQIRTEIGEIVKNLKSENIKYNN